MEIKKDLESSKPMDRLLCGDVGYGKTEVIFRAVFKAVMNNKQVMYLCPTTLLSYQQYVSALSRFKNHAVNIALLNRYTTKKETNSILKDLEEGKIDVIFGTHRLLSGDIKFKDLGLLVIDEEQRFGVMHKEKIKEIKSNVHVLSVSATPIPRSLQMSLIGVRDLSLIETPPVNKLPVQTYVISYDAYVLRDVVLKEKARGGQVFILYNKVEDMPSIAEKFRKLLPEVSINYAHGKMNKEQMQDIMYDFTLGKFDVLLSTTIIENGIDIAIGSRFVTAKKPWSLRMLGSRVISACIFLTTGKRITDPTSGMRAYNKNIIKEYALDMNNPPEPDTLVYMLKKKKKIKEIQVEMSEREQGTSSFNVGHTIKYMCRMIISIFFIQPFRKRK